MKPVGRTWWVVLVVIVVILIFLIVRWFTFSEGHGGLTDGRYWYCDVCDKGRGSDGDPGYEVSVFVPKAVAGMSKITTYEDAEQLLSNGLALGLHQQDWQDECYGGYATRSLRVNRSSALVTDGGVAASDGGVDPYQSGPPPPLSPALTSLPVTFLRRIGHDHRRCDWPSTDAGPQTCTLPSPPNGGYPDGGGALSELNGIMYYNPDGGDGYNHYIFVPCADNADAGIASYADAENQEKLDAGHVLHFDGKHSIDAATGLHEYHPLLYQPDWKPSAAPK